MGGFSVCRDGRENSPQASERPWDVLFFYVITKMIDRRRNYNLSGHEQPPRPSATSFCSWALHVGTETSPTNGPPCGGWRLQQHMWSRHTALIHRILSHLYTDDATCPHLIAVMRLWVSLRRWVSLITAIKWGHVVIVSLKSLRETNCFSWFPRRVFLFFFFFFSRTLEIKNFQVLLSWPLSVSLSLSLLAATPHPLYDFVIGQKGTVDYLLLLSHPSSTSQLQGRCQWQPLCNCLVITVKMGCASGTNRPSLTSWTQLECRT